MDSLSSNLGQSYRSHSGVDRQSSVSGLNGWHLCTVVLFVDLGLFYPCGVLVNWVLFFAYKTFFNRQINVKKALFQCSFRCPNY